jgi:hypothetical protein
VQPDSPGADKESNWQPAPKEADFSLYVRAYWPQEAHKREVDAAAGGDEPMTQ